MKIKDIITEGFFDFFKTANPVQAAATQRRQQQQQPKDEWKTLSPEEKNRRIQQAKKSKRVSSNNPTNSGNNRSDNEHWSNKGIHKNIPIKYNDIPSNASNSYQPNKPNPAWDALKKKWEDEKNNTKNSTQSYNQQPQSSNQQPQSSDDKVLIEFHSLISNILVRARNGNLTRDEANRVADFNEAKIIPFFMNNPKFSSNLNSTAKDLLQKIKELSSLAKSGQAFSNYGPTYHDSGTIRGGEVAKRKLTPAWVARHGGMIPDSMEEAEIRRNQDRFDMIRFKLNSALGTSWLHKSEHNPNPSFDVIWNDLHDEYKLAPDWRGEITANEIRDFLSLHQQGYKTPGDYPY
jgi:hypothetical protein